MRLEHLPEPPLRFGESPFYEIIDPVYGLNNFGPFDVANERDFDSLSIVAVGPQSQTEPFQALWESLVGGVERLEYEPKYEEGFEAIYRLKEVSLVKEHNGYVAIDNFHGPIEEKYRAAIRYAQDNCRFDVLFIIEPEQSVYYLHDLLKRECVSLGVFSQYLERETLSKRAQGSVLHNIAVGTYAKAGGVPWRVKHPTINNSCILGLSFHIVRKKEASQTHRTIVGVAEVLDEFGQHLTMKVSQVDVSQDVVKQFQREHTSLYVPRGWMKNLVKDALSSTLWPSRIPPTRLVVHKTTAFHEEEISGLQTALEELEVNIEYALVHIKEETVQRVYREADKNAVRGLLLVLRDDIPEVVLWTVGKVPSKYWNKSEGDYAYFEKSGTKIGTSDPIAVYLDSASRCSDFNVVDAARQVLALTKMRWNTVEMSIRLPVSIYLARRVGNVVAAAQRHEADMSFVERVDARHFW
jgi:hypothetical protein